MDRYMKDGSLDHDNVESFSFHDDGKPRDFVGRCMDGSKGAVNVTPCILFYYSACFLQLPVCKCMAFASGKYFMFCILPQSYLFDLYCICSNILFMHLSWKKTI